MLTKKSKNVELNIDIKWNNQFDSFPRLFFASENGK